MLQFFCQMFGITNMSSSLYECFYDALLFVMGGDLRFPLNICPYVWASDKLWIIVLYLLLVLSVLEFKVYHKPSHTDWRRLAYSFYVLTSLTLQILVTQFLTMQNMHWLHRSFIHQVTIQEILHSVGIWLLNSLQNNSSLNGLSTVSMYERS